MKENDMTQRIIPREEWLRRFKSEYRRRTGMTWEDSGSTDEDALSYHPSFSPLSAVLHQIEKYDLIDITVSDWRNP
jgi:hypothetical protein